MRGEVWRLGAIPKSRLLLGAAACAVWSVAGCSAVAAKSESGWGVPGPIGDGDVAGDGDASGDGDGLPPEMELEETFRAPVVAGKFLWSANPETNKVARIDASTLEIEVLDGGHAPTYLAALPAGTTPGGALVLNELSQDASVFLLDEESAVVSHDRISVQRGASAWAVGEQGSFAVAWSRSSENLLNTEDGYQDLTVMDFRGDEIETTTLSVGFRPSQVVVNQDETRAFVVSDPGISVIRLGDNVGVLRELFLPTSETNGARDVSFSVDGRLAFVRLEGASEILLVDTETNERATVTLPGVVTDLDLSADGSLAVAVVRGGPSAPDAGTGGAAATGGAGSMGGAGPMGGAPPEGSGGGENLPEESHIALLPTATIFGEPSDFTVVSTQELVGSAVVARDASYVLLFTNAMDSPYISILDTEELEIRVVDLKAPVRAAFLSDDAGSSVVLMKAPEDSSKQGAFALLPVKAELPPRIQGTDVAPEFVSLSSQAGRALITTGSSTSRRARSYFGRFPSLQLDEVELPSRPLASGIVPDAGQAFVAQQHAEGRVTFIELESGADQTVTGFELSSRVVQR
jgi:hypothetical protein